MKKVLITVIIVVGVLALIGWVLTSNKKENEAKTAVVAQGSGAVVVKTEDVKKASVNLNFAANGNFIASQDLVLKAESSGRVTRLLVSEGSRVSKGQVLAHIDDEVLSLDLQTAEEALQKLKIDHQRYKSSFETGGVTRAQLDDIELNLRNAEIRLQQAKRRVADSYVKAPISGVINHKYVELGSYVAPATELFDIVDVSKLKLQVTVNEFQVVNLSVGNKVAITTSVFPDREFTGTISFIAAKADNTLNYPIEIQVGNEGSNALKAGMYATATFEFPEQAPAILVPRGAFVGSVNSNQVYVLENDSLARIREVTAGRIFGEQVEILKGLNEGERVITSGQINLVDGAQVEPQKN